MDFIGLFVVAYWIVECTGLLFLARPHVLESVGHRFVICIPFVVDLYEHGFCARLIDGFGFTATGENELLHPMRSKGWSFTGRLNPRLGQFLAGY